MTMQEKRISKLINALEIAMDRYWDDIANRGYSDNSGDIYDWVSELQHVGLGAVKIKTQRGIPAWFSLEEMTF